MKNIKLIEVPSEIGAGTRGASLGVEAIKIAALDFMSNFFVHFPSEKIEVENKLLYEPIQSPYAKRMQGILNMSERISKAVADSIKGHFFPVILSGDHSNAAGTIAGIKIAKPKSKFLISCFQLFKNRRYKGANRRLIIVQALSPQIGI